jgi:hypothetical protein
MAITVGVNSYLDLEEAGEYFENRLDVVEWTSSTDIQKEQALTTSAMLLNTLQWQGTVIDSSQKLAFPRNGTYFDPLYGEAVEIGLPERIKQAQCELAHHLLSNDGVLDDTGGVQSLELENIKLINISKPDKFPFFVKMLIAPLQIKNSRLWWRAN